MRFAPLARFVLQAFFWQVLRSLLSFFKSYLRYLLFRMNFSYISVILIWVSLQCCSKRQDRRILSCGSFICVCMHKYIKYLNKFSVAHMALKGDGYITSVKEAIGYTDEIGIENLLAWMILVGNTISLAVFSGLACMLMVKWFPGQYATLGMFISFSISFSGIHFLFQIIINA